MTTYFISDLHLSKSRPELTAALLEFLSTDAKNADALYVLGDLFEYWVGDDAAGALEMQPVLDSFYELTQNTPGFFIAGNRDFLVRERFSKETGLKILPDESIIDLYGEPVLLLHGDSLCTDDVKHQTFRRRIVLNRPLCYLFLKLPLSWRLHQARRARAQSQGSKPMMDSAIMDVTDSAVEQAFQTRGVETMIHGHTHRQHIHTHAVNGQECRRYVLGDWGKTNSILKVTPNEMLFQNQAI